MRKSFDQKRPVVDNAGRAAKNTPVTKRAGSAERITEDSNIRETQDKQSIMNSEMTDPINSEITQVLNAHQK